MAEKREAIEDVRANVTGRLQAAIGILLEANRLVRRQAADGVVDEEAAASLAMEMAVVNAQIGTLIQVAQALPVARATKRKAA